jgi:hypothetical protein
MILSQFSPRHILAHCFSIIMFVLIIIIIIGKDTIFFMQGIYTYIPETNHVLKEFNVAAILSLLFMVPISLVPAFALMYFYISTFRSLLLLLLLLLLLFHIRLRDKGVCLCVVLYIPQTILHVKSLTSRSQLTTLFTVHF